MLRKQQGRVDFKAHVWFPATAWAGIFFAGAAWAGETAHGVAYHETLARHLAAEGDTEAAFGHWLRAFLEDPAAEGPRRRLRALVETDHPFLSETQRRDWLRLLDLGDYQAFLMRRIKALQDEADRLLSEGPTRDGGLRGRSERSAAAWRRITVPRWSPPESMSYPNRSRAARTADWILIVARYNRALLRCLEDMREDVAVLRRARPRVVRRIGVPSEGGGDKSSAKMGYEDGGEVSHRSASGGTTVLRSKALRLRLSEMEDRMRVMEARLAKVTRDLAAVSLEKMEKERALADRLERIASLERDLREAEERLELVQRIMQDKDARIQALETQVRRLEEGGDGGVLRKQIEALKVMMKTRARDDRERIAALEVELETLRRRSADLEMRVDAGRRRAERLELRLASKDRTIADYKRALAQSARKVAELDGMLTLFRERLHETAAELKRMETLFQGLRKRIGLEGDAEDLSGGRAIRRGPLSDPTYWDRREILRRTRERIDGLRRMFGADTLP